MLLLINERQKALVCWFVKGYSWPKGVSGCTVKFYIAFASESIDEERQPLQNTESVSI